MTDKQGGRGSGSPVELATVAFGVDLPLDQEQAAKLLGDLTRIWAAHEGRAPDSLASDLRLLDKWFNPTRTGKSLRALVERLQPVTPSATALPPFESVLAFHVDDERLILTPEGRVILELLRSWLERGVPRPVVMDGPVLIEMVSALLNHYQAVTRQRLTSVSSLLKGEATTMRPAVAGLLLFLILNGNTSPSQALPKRLPSGTEGDRLSRAIAGPVSAFTRALGAGDSDAQNAVDLYRGWAYGELARRLGGAMSDDGVSTYLRGVEVAQERLEEYVQSRPLDQRRRLPDALEAAVDAYARVRPYLNSIGAAFDRPAKTSRLLRALAAAAASEDRLGEQ